MMEIKRICDYFVAINGRERKTGISIGRPNVEKNCSEWRNIYEDCTTNKKKVYGAKGNVYTALEDIDLTT
jgi:hypothetical protein